MRPFIAFCILFSWLSLNAQTSFPEKCLGIWTGTMNIYNRGSLVDSVTIKLNVTRTNAPDTFVWKTEYLSEKFPMVKDYKLVISDAGKGVFITDEGDGIILMDYLFENKLYSVFETQGILLTSTYEWLGNQIIFEVTSGKELQTTLGVKSYSVLNLQKAVLRKMN
jgi:5'(3')-deoxyribonucleotidase